VLQCIGDALANQHRQRWSTIIGVNGGCSRHDAIAVWRWRSVKSFLPPQQRSGDQVPCTRKAGARPGTLHSRGTSSAGFTGSTSCRLEPQSDSSLADTNGSQLQENVSPLALEFRLNCRSRFPRRRHVRSIQSKRARNTPVGSGAIVMDSGHERRDWSGGSSSWPRGD